MIYKTNQVRFIYIYIACASVYVHELVLFAGMHTSKSKNFKVKLKASQEHRASMLCADTIKSQTYYTGDFF